MPITKAHVRRVIPTMPTTRGVTQFFMALLLSMHVPAATLIGQGD
jgi:hypothetical protein